MGKSGGGQQIQLHVAASALRRLLADPRRTEEVFTVIQALSGPSLARGLSRFRNLPAGKARLSDHRQLLDSLRDRQSLAKLPETSLGHSYLDFIRTEQISADGLVEASLGHSHSDDSNRNATLCGDELFYAQRLRDQHDLWHTLTQYGRDELGEVCLLAFTYAQTKNRGVGLITLATQPKMIRKYGWSVLGSIWQAYRDGRRCQWLPGQDWETLLIKPLEQVRAELRVSPPCRYLAARYSAV